MALLSKRFDGLSFSSRQRSDGNLGCSSIQEEPIQRPPEDTDMEEEMDSEDCLVELEILPDCTVAKQLLIQVAPQHHLPDEEEILPFFSTVAEPLMAQFEDPEKELPSFFTEVAEPLMVQEALAEVEQEHPPQRRMRRRRKKEKQAFSSTRNLPDETPAKPKHAWIDVGPAEDTKAEEEMIKEEREVEDKTPVMKMKSVEIVEVDLRQERRKKKERKTECDTSLPAKAKLAWTEMDGDSAKFTHTKKREEEKRMPERRAKVEDRKTEQAADITPAKGEKTQVQELEGSSKISRKQNGLLHIYKMAKKRFTAEREKMKIRVEEKKQRKLLYERYANDPSVKHLLINKHDKLYGCALGINNIYNGKHLKQIKHIFDI